MPAPQQLSASLQIIMKAAGNADFISKIMSTLADVALDV